MSEGLESFSKAHVIGEDAVELVVGEEGDPVGAGFLVVAELGLKAIGWGEFFLGSFFGAEFLAEGAELGRGIDGEGFGF